MERILLLEANYKNKFPPVGLMKLAYYHTNHRGDFVWFSKGKLKNELPESVRHQIRESSYYKKRYSDEIEEYIARVSDTIRGGKWDRVYVTTLFTFEWKKTVEMIEYAKTLVDDPSRVFVGGVAATLMPKEFERETGIKPMTGLISDSSALGYESGVCVDSLIPDYSILEHIEYRYHHENGYFLTATRGCGNRCSFCAVQILEPQYQHYLPIVPRIEQINELYGEKRNLYLMDNNVLKSDSFARIIEDIKTAGFGKGAVWINPKTGKPNIRSIDFNQGLDAKFLTDAKARLLGEIALEPAHIAFDHIDEKDRYVRAVKLMEKHGIRNVCSYLLYNTKNFSGKGDRRDADSPKDLYERMRINFDTCHSLNEKRAERGLPPFRGFAFPMRFVPLNAKSRIFIGANWTKKLLDGLATLLQPSHGVIFNTPDYHTYMYGNSCDEFCRTLLMPREYIKRKGMPVHKYPDGIHPYRTWLDCMDEWTRLYLSLDEQLQTEFIAVISDNDYTADKFLSTKDRTVQKLYLHYFTGNAMPGFLDEIKSTREYAWVQEYILHECPAVFWSCIGLYKSQKTGSKRCAPFLRLIFAKSFCTQSEAV